MGFCIYKGAAFCCGCLYWFHQWRIPRHTCRFYLLLAGAVGKRQGIAIPYPSPTPLLTPGGYPLRRGISAAAVDRDLVSLYPVQIAYPHVRIRFFYLCSGWGFSRFSRFRWACIVRFSLVVGWTVRSCGYVVFCYGLSLGLPLTAIGTIVFCW